MTEMSHKGITTRNQRLYDYLSADLGFDTENFSFGDTYGQLQAEHYDTDFLEINLPPDEIAPQFAWGQTQSKTVASHEYVLHLIISNFSKDLTLLLVQLTHWLQQEQQMPRIDYKLTWNNNHSVDLNLYIEMLDNETLTNDKGGTRTTC